MGVPLTFVNAAIGNFSLYKEGLWISFVSRLNLIVTDHLSCLVFSAELLLILVNVAIGIRHFTRRAFGSALFLDEIHLQWITCLIWPLSLFDGKAREFLFLHL